MSLSREVDIECRACGVPQTVRAVTSFNPNRLPHLKQKLLDGELNKYGCLCGASFVAEVDVLYLDHIRGQLFLAFPRARLTDVDACLVEARRIFERGFGEATPEVAQEVGRDLMVRVCFGLDQLRDKVVADDAGLSDLALEELKCRILDERDDLREQHVVHLALVRVTPEALELTSQGPDGVRTPRIVVARGRYDEVAALGHDAILVARPSLVRGPHVSMLRVVLDP